MSYELWGAETRNLIETFESQGEALEAVRRLVAVNASVYPAALALVFEDGHGETSFISSRRELEGLAQSTRRTD